MVKWKACSLPLCLNGGGEVTVLALIKVFIFLPAREHSAPVRHQQMSPPPRFHPPRLCRHFSDAAVGPNKSVCLCILTPPQHEWERAPQGVGALITPRRDGAKTVGELGLARLNSEAQGWRSSDPG